MDECDHAIMCVAAPPALRVFGVALTRTNTVRLRSLWGLSPIHRRIETRVQVIPVELFKSRLLDFQDGQVDQRYLEYCDRHEVTVFSREALIVPAARPVEQFHAHPQPLAPDQPVPGGHACQKRDAIAPAKTQAQPATGDPYRCSHCRQTLVAGRGRLDAPAAGSCAGAGRKAHRLAKPHRHLARHRTPRQALQPSPGAPACKSRKIR